MCRSVSHSLLHSSKLPPLWIRDFRFNYYPLSSNGNKRHRLYSAKLIVGLRWAARTLRKKYMGKEELPSHDVLECFFISELKDESWHYHTLQSQLSLLVDIKQMQCNSFNKFFPFLSKGLNNFSVAEHWSKVANVIILGRLPGVLQLTATWINLL